MKNIAATVLISSALALANPAESSENGNILPLSEQFKERAGNVLNGPEKKDGPMLMKTTIIVDTKNLKKSALAKKGISPTLASFLGENQSEQIITTHNPTIRKRYPQGTRIMYSEIDSIEMPLVFDELRNVFPEKIEDFIAANPLLAKGKSGDTGIFVVRIRETNKYALAYYQEGALKLATHSSPGKPSGSSKWKNGQMLAGGIKTPEGVFTVGYKEANKTSRAFENAPMPYALNVHGWVFIHTGRVDGTPLSHGCIRIPGLYAKELFDIVPLGTKVVVSFHGVDVFRKETEPQKPEETRRMAQN